MCNIQKCDLEFFLIKFESRNSHVFFSIIILVAVKSHLKKYLNFIHFLVVLCALLKCIFFREEIKILTEMLTVQVTTSQ